MGTTAALNHPLRPVPSERQESLVPLWAVWLSICLGTHSAPLCKSICSVHTFLGAMGQAQGCP